MEDTIWASIKTDWHQYGRCSGTFNPMFFPDEETEARLLKVKSLFCDHCPVRTKCLNSAVINKDIGFWGGTSTEMRAAMKRTRYRAKCPVCRSNSLIDVEGDDEESSCQVCLACAASWRYGSPLHLNPEENPVEAVSA